MTKNVLFPGTIIHNADVVEEEKEEREREKERVREREERHRERKIEILELMML